MCGVLLFARFLLGYRAENFCYHIKHGQVHMPQFRKIIGLVCSLRSHIKRQDTECFGCHAGFCDVLMFAFCLATAPRIFAIISSTDKNTCRNFAKLSAWFVRSAHLSNDSGRMYECRADFCDVLMFVEFLFCYRAENFCYHIKHGQAHMPQFRKIIGLVFVRSAHLSKDSRKMYECRADFCDILLFARFLLC